MKAGELRSKSLSELNAELSSLQEEHFNLRFQHETNNLDNPMQLRQVRRNIARVKTIIREAELKAKKEAK